MAVGNVGRKQNTFRETLSLKRSTLLSMLNSTDMLALLDCRRDHDWFRIKKIEKKNTQRTKFRLHNREGKKRITVISTAEWLRRSENECQLRNKQPRAKTYGTLRYICGNQHTVQERLRKQDERR